MTRRRRMWRWACLICGHREWQEDGLGAVDSFEEHYYRTHIQWNREAAPGTRPGATTQQGSIA